MLHIICFGNLWQGDDGFGVHVFQRLCAMKDLPPDVKAFDAGIAGLGALDLFENCRKAIVIDAIKTGSRVGSAHRLSLEDLALTFEGFSLHDSGLNQLLAFLPTMFENRVMPEVVIIGAEIDKIDPFTDKLTPALEAAVDEVIGLTLKEVFN